MPTRAAPGYARGARMSIRDWRIMTRAASGSQSDRRRREWGHFLLPAALLVAIALTALVLTRSFYDPQWNLTIADVVESATPERGVSDYVEVTPSVCADGTCVEAYDTQEALYLRFASRDDAARYVSHAEDAFRSNYIVMDFSTKPDVAPERQQRAMEYLVSTWQDFEGTLPSRR